MSPTQSILVPDAQTRAMLAAIRSLGRAGYEVHAMAASARAMGLRSKFSNHGVIAPNYEDPKFRDWLSDYCRVHKIKMIVPSGGLLDAVRPSFNEFKRLLPVSSSPEIAYRAGDKIAAFEAYLDAPAHQRLLDHHPKSIIAKQGHAVEFEDLKALEPPIFLKASERDSSHQSGDRVYECQTAFHAIEQLERIFAEGYSQVLIQSGVEGIQVGVSTLMSKNGPLALSCVRDSHPRPHSKGTMSLRHSWWHPRMVDDAVARLTALEWEGCAMVEYRWIPSTDQFHVIEINARFWQYLHLDLHAGIDFPRLLAEWFLDGRTPEPLTPKKGVVCRDTFPGEVAQLVNCIRDSEISRIGKARAIGAFFIRSLDPRIHSDLLFPGDRMVYLREFRHFIASELRSLR